MAKIELPELSLEGFFYVPNAGIYLAKERRLNGSTWENAIKEIYEEGVEIEKQRVEMPTPFEFMSGLIYALDNENIPGLTEDERQKFLDDILKIGKYRGNQLNARFPSESEMETAGLENGKLKWERKPLEECLTRDCYADIRNINSQGLFTDESPQQDYVFGQNAYFWPLEKAVARFDADSGGAGLCCDRGLRDSSPSLGVRLVIRPKGARLKNSQSERVEVYTPEQIKGALKRAKLQGIESVLLDALKQ